MGKQKHDQGNKKRAAREQPKTETKMPSPKALAWKLVRRGLCTSHILEDSVR